MGERVLLKWEEEATEGSGVTDEVRILNGLFQLMKRQASY